MTDKVLFNCLPWYGQTLIQGNKSFFMLLSDLLQTVSEKTLELHLSNKTPLTLSDKIEFVLFDIKESFECEDPSWVSEYTEDSMFVRFNGLNQLVISRHIAFEIGERVRAGMNLICQTVSPDNLNAMYAFSRVVQTACVANKIFQK